VGVFSEHSVYLPPLLLEVLRCANSGASGCYKSRHYSLHSTTTSNVTFCAKSMAFMAQKVCHKLLSIHLPTIGWFTKFFH